jgi:hypothetical protein
MVPPYFGVPRLSHQFPVEVVVATAEVVVAPVIVDVVAGAVVVLVVDVVFIVAVDVAFEVVAVAEPQDANTIDITTRLVSNIQVIPLFM